MPLWAEILVGCAAFMLVELGLLLLAADYDLRWDRWLLRKLFPKRR
jgi:hypothetical protein